jgi:undecaprenyl-diphosphatase
LLADAPGWVQAIVLGLVQGVTEFIPVSSSGHLVLVPAVAGWERHGLAFDVALHLGTLLALVVYYRTDLFQMVRATVIRTPSPERDGYRRLLLLLIVASVPVAVVGVTLGDTVEAAFGAPRFTAAALLVTAAILVSGERLHRRQVARSIAGGEAPDHEATSATGRGAAPRVSHGQALIVGVAQCLALLPGVSRSGTTISAGIAAGLPRPVATRFAFLLGLPAIAGAAIVQLPNVDDLERISMSELALGVGAAAISGYLAIALLVRLVSRAGLERFAWYLVPVAIVSFVIVR